jgi:hypothetical protein
MNDVFRFFVLRPPQSSQTTAVDLEACARALQIDAEKADKVSAAMQSLPKLWRSAIESDVPVALIIVSR